MEPRPRRRRPHGHGRHRLLRIPTLRPGNIVTLNNAGTHYHPRIKQLIESVGAQLVCNAPFSPDLSAVEPPFHQYKAYMRRACGSGIDWREAYVSALYESITHENMFNYYRKIGCTRNVPAVLTVTEKKKLPLLLLQQQQ